MKDSISTKARVYAETLLAVADEKGTTADVDRALGGVAKMLRRNPEFGTFFRTAALSALEKRRLVEDVFSPSKGVPVHLFNLLRLLADRHDLGALPGIAREWQHLLDERAGRIRFKIYSAQPLDQGEIDRIARAVGGSLKKEALPEAAVEKDLLGGVVLQIEDVRIDGSVKTRLDRMRARLLETFTP